MEAIAALGLANNILQLVDFGLTAATSCKEIYSSVDGFTTKTATIDDIACESEVAVKSLQQSIHSNDSALNAEDEELKQLGSKASEAVTKLRELIQKLCSQGIKPRKRDAVVKTIKSFWYADELEQISTELHEYRSVLDTCLLVDLRKRLIASSSEQKTQTRRLDDLDEHSRRIYDTLTANQGQNVGYFDQISQGIHNLKIHSVTARATKLSHSILYPSNEILDTLEQAFETRGRRAVTGIGGIGKSQIAIEFSYRYRENNPSHHILWVHCSNRNRFSQVYKNIARQLGLPGLDQRDVDWCQLITEHLNRSEFREWMMILDNVDDLTLFEAKSSETEPSTFSLNTYLPKEQSSRLLITSRDRRICERLASIPCTIDIGVPPMEDATRMMHNGISMSRLELENYDKLENLATSLAFLPLAMTQAVAFICENNATVEEYLELCSSVEGDFEEILQQDFGDQRRDFDSSNSVYKTWKVSFDCVQRQNHLAANLLALMSVLDRQGVPKTLLRKEAQNSFTFRAAVTLLQKFRLVEERKENGLLEMHRLLHLCMQMRKQLQGNEAYWQGQALTYMEDEFPSSVEFETLKYCELLMPHTALLMRLQPANDKHRLNLLFYPTNLEHIN